MNKLHIFEDDEIYIEGITFTGEQIIHAIKKIYGGQFEDYDTN